MASRASERSGVVVEGRRRFFIGVLLCVLGGMLWAYGSNQRFRLEVVEGELAALVDDLDAARKVAQDPVDEAKLTSFMHAADRARATLVGVESAETVRTFTGILLLLGLGAGVLVALRFPRLAELVDRVRGSAQTLARATEDITTVADQQMQRSTSQAESVLQLATTAEEIATASRSISQNAATMQEIAGRALRACEEGRSQVTRSVDEMGAVQRQVHALADAMGLLGETAGRIGAIVEIIDEISDQTNLLALNAAIEAAGAGEAGKRFAVVATEVRRLSERTVEATAQISELVDETRGQVQNAIELTRSGAQEVERGVGVVQNLGDTFESIYSTVSDTGAQVDEIRSSTEEQTVATDQMAFTVGGVQATVEQVLEGAEVARRSAEDLQALSASLLELVQDEEDGR